jgi:hypothetical protein
MGSEARFLASRHLTTLLTLIILTVIMCPTLYQSYQHPTYLLGWMSMGLEILYELGRTFSEAFSAVNGIGAVLVIVGFTILAIIGVSVGLYMFAKLVKQIPNMTVWEFVKFTTLFAIALIIVGIILP